jgi:hypothetical protein
MPIDLAGVYDLLAGVDCSFTDSGSVSRTVTAYKYDTMPANLLGITLPVRVLWLVRPDAQDGEVSPAAFTGSSLTVEWGIHDTMYFARGGQGYTLATVMHDLILYMNAHAAAVASNKRLATGVNVTGWSYKPGIYEWGGVDFLGVDVVTRITELSKRGN